MSSSKKVGIGNLAPTSELTVQGDISASGNLNIQGSITATSITSSFVTSSVVLTEGSTVFGDASTDTHKFIGNITASGNISASGTSHTFGGDVTIGDDLFLGDGGVINFSDSDATITGDSDNLDLSHIQGSFEGGIRISTFGHIQFATVHDGNLNFGTDTRMMISMSGADGTAKVGIGTIVPAEHLTVEGNISASGTITGLSGSFQNVDILDNDAGVNPRLRVGRNTSENIQFSVVDNDVRIIADQDSDSDGDHNFTLNRTFDGSGANNFKIQKGGTDQFVIDTSGNITASGAISASQLTTSSFGRGYFQAADANSGLALHVSADGDTSNLPSANASTRFSVTQTGNAGGFNGMTVVGGHSTGASIYKFGDKDNEQIGRFIYYHQYNRLDTFVNNTKAMSIDSSQRTGFGGIDAPQNTVHISGSMLVGTGSLDGHITASGNYSGSATSTFRIGGKLIAGSKSFVIDRPEGGKLEYGVLEGQQNDVFFRGELKGDNVIYLPQEWEWLVDDNTITVQLTSIGKHQELFVKEIKNNKIFIDINGMCKGKNDIHCYHIIHGTRKDVELIRNYQ